MNYQRFILIFEKILFIVTLKNSLERKSTRTVLDILFHHLLTLLAPILCFTTEEAWQSRYGSNEECSYKNFPRFRIIGKDQNWIASGKFIKNQEVN